MALSGTLERKNLAHFIDENFGTGTASYVRLGKDLEEYSVEMNADVEQKKNILGESSARVKGYTPQGSVEPFYAEAGSALFTALLGIINGRSTGDSLKTTVIDCLVEYGSNDTLTVSEAYKEDAIIVPQSIGGEDGVQIPFDIYYDGNRTPVSGTISGGKFVISNG